MGGWIHERGGVVDHQYIVKSGAKRVGVMLHEEEGIFHISQAQLDAHGFKYDIIAKHQKHLYSGFGEYFVSLFDTTLNKPGTLVEVWADRTAPPNRHKLLSEGNYEYVTNRRPNKWRHAFTAKQRVTTASRRSRRLSSAYQEAESRAVRDAVKPIITIETCDGWIIIIILVIWWIKTIKERKCIACPELEGIDHIQVATQPVSSGERDITDPVKLVKLIQQQHPNLTLRGMVAGFLLNGGSHFPRVVSSLPEAFTLLETHNNIQEVVEVVSSRRLAEGKPMPSYATQLIYDITLAAMHGPVLANISDRNDEAPAHHHHHQHQQHRPCQPCPCAWLAASLSFPPLSRD
ncbi:unnamed protein product [Vitrella brassicaformis CCMP3155]|uniref:Uncharacterized protein n=1 Tax=Vitrella brassicaformis (strain CCMP3155) TaxID=1169540 RepID=A0A0G4G6G6_VITBC|nr:unnamed protein product [Vitrella brassicaformis CCMP3155]|eukprot:CEM24122.1 unnamed protein product [Vitrella brassicaformis CCMP3155]